MIIGELTKLWLHSLKSTFFHFFDDIRDFRRSVELCSVSMNFQKLPCVCVYDCRIWSMYRTTTPFASRDRRDHKRSYEHKFHVIGSYRNYFEGLWSLCRLSPKLTFWGRGVRLNVLVIVKFEKSSFPYFSDHRIWSKHRTTTPLTSGDRYDH